MLLEFRQRSRMSKLLGVVPYDLQWELFKPAGGIIVALELMTIRMAAVMSECHVLGIAKRERWIIGTFADDEHLFEISLKPAFPSMNASSGYVTLGVRIIPWQLSWTERYMWA